MQVHFKVTAEVKGAHVDFWENGKLQCTYKSELKKNYWTQKTKNMQINTPESSRLGRKIIENLVS